MNLTFKRPEYNAKKQPMRTDWPRIVAFSGPAGSGKTTAANHLVEVYGYRRIRFADPIKDMLRDFGLTFDQIDGPFKETPCDLLCGKTPRRAMQLLGDEYGRQLIGNDIWVRAWERRLEEAMLWNSDVRIVVDDLRYPNELDALLRHDALIVRVHRPDARPVESHASENHALFNQRVLINDWTTSDFVNRLELLLDGCVQLPCAQHEHQTPHPMSITTYKQGADEMRERICALIHQHHYELAVRYHGRNSEVALLIKNILADIREDHALEEFL